jgi:4-hydroxy-tetrahydrodipicolinate synthase
MFRGTYTALVTPFQNDEFDYEAFARLIEAQIAAGITGIVPVGTTGESPTLSHGERRQVIELAVQAARKRCQIIAGTGSNSTRDAIAHTKEAEEIGVDGALLVAPYYNKPSQEGLFRHFAAIAESTSLKLVLYNIPGRCGVDIAADTVVRLAESCPNIVAIKEASGSVDRVSELVGRLPDGFTVLSGDDSLTLPFLAVGAAGVVSVASNLFPAEVSQLVRLFLEGRADEARRLHRKFFALFKDIFIEPNPVPAKTILAWRGMMSAECRLPLVGMTEANAARLRKTLDALENAG